MSALQIYSAEANRNVELGIKVRALEKSLLLPRALKMSWSDATVDLMANTAGFVTCRKAVGLSGGWLDLVLWEVFSRPF